MFTLSVPLSDPSALPYKVETRTGATSDWLARLPSASPVETAQKLVMALHGLNRIPLDENDRIGLLALYRPVVARTAAGLESLLSEAGVPPHVQQQQAGSLLRELHTEHSIGYKHLLRSLSSRRFGRNQIRHIAEVTAHLLAALRNVQLAGYLTYTQTPQGLWREIHTHYLLAKSNGMSDKPVNDAPSADQVYNQALLLELSDPPHMSHAELDHVRLYLDAVGNMAQLGSPSQGANPIGFAIDSSSDRGPQSAGPEAGDLWLDTEALCRHVHETAVRLRTGETPRKIGLPSGMGSETSLILTKRLLKQWRPGSHRAYNRYPSPGSAMQIVAGVSAIHQQLNPARHAAWPAALHDEKLPSRDGLAFVAAPVTTHPSNWTVINDSAAGLALSGTPGVPLNLQVGDALALRADKAASWSLGVIRWIKMLDARQVELGVERLSPRIQSAWVRPLRGHCKDRSEPGLFVPGLPALNQPDRLLLPNHVYEKGMDAEVWYTSRHDTVTFKRRAESTPGFDLIDFTPFTVEPTP